MLRLPRLIRANVVRLIAVLLISLGFGCSSALAADKLTKIAVTYCVDCVPFHYRDDNGAPAGIIVDYWNLWSEKTGIELDFVSAPWVETLKMVGDGRVDAHVGLFFSKERDRFLDYGVSLTKTDTHVFFHRDIKPPKTVAELAAFHIAVVSGDLVEGWLKERLGADAVVGFSDYGEIIEKLRSGTIKVFAADTATGLHHLGRAGLRNLFTYEKRKPLYSSEWFVATREGNQALLDVINAGMRQITREERLRITRAWATGQRSKTDTGIIVALWDNYPPFSFIGLDGKPQGLLVDIWSEWGRVVGRPIKFRTTSWAETIEGLRLEEVDVHSGLFKTPERAEWISFTDPLQNVETALYVKSGTPEFGTLGSLAGKKVGAIKGSFQAQFLREEHPEIQLVEIEDQIDYLTELLSGEIDGFIDEVPSVEGNLARFGLAGSIARQQMLFSNLMYGGVLKNNPDLFRLVDSGMRAISRATMAEIEARWITNPEDRFFRDAEGVVYLTEREKAWIKQHPLLRFAVTDFLRPVDIVDKEGNYTGLNADLIALLNKKLGTNVLPEFFKSWSAVVEAATSGKVDGAFSVSRTPEREKSLEFTSPYAYDPIIVVVRDNEATVTSWDTLKGQKVVAVEGTAVIDELRTQVGEGTLVQAKNDGEAIKLLAEGNAVAYVGYLIPYGNAQTNNYVPGLSIVEKRNVEDGLLRIAMHNSQPVLKSIMTKGVNALTRDELATLRERWLVAKPPSSLGASLRAELTREQRAWLDAHPKIRLGDDFAWPPFSFIDDNDSFSGIAAGYVEAISRRLGIEFLPLQGLSWPEVLKRIKLGDIDVLPAIARTPEREEFLRFTKPYISFPVVIATRKDAPFVDGLGNLYGLKVGVVEDYVTDDLLTENYAQLDIIRVKDVKSGLSELEEGKIQAFVDNLGVITYEIDQSELQNIKIAAPTEYRFELSFGVRKDWPELVVLLDKALDAIDEKERNAIKNAWMAVQVKFGLDMKTVLLWAVPIAFSAMTIILVVVVWNRKMGREIDERKKAQANLREARDEAQEATKAKATFLATMSHEIRTPMGGVIGMVDILQQTKLTDDQRQMIGTVRDSAHSLLTIINDILDFSKIEAGKLDLEKIPVSIRDIVESAGEALAVNARNKGISLIVFVDPEIPDALLGDQVRLRQILFNFGSNAIKFTEQGKVFIV